MIKFTKIVIPLTLAVATLVVGNEASATYYNRDAFFAGNGLPDASIGALIYWEEDSVSTWGYYYYSLDARTELDKVESAVINFRRATSSEINSAPLRYFAGQMSEYSWYGRVYPYDIAGYEMDIDGAQSYGWSKVDLKYNDYLMDYDALGTEERRRVAVHELGHVMSLKHQPIGSTHQSSVMQETFKLNKSWNLTSVDIANLQYMY